MGLKEIAIETYKKEVEKEKENNLKLAEDFAVQAMKTLKNRIGDKFHIVITSKQPYETFFDVEGIKFVVDTGGSIDIIKTCQMCKKDYRKHLMASYNHDHILADLGKILLLEHDEFDCKQNLDGQQEKQLTTEEKFLDSLKEYIGEIVTENM